MTTLIADGNNLVMRGIHAMARRGLGADGVATGPLLVVINSLSRHIREERPDKVVVCWDNGPSAFRLALYPEYKAHRSTVDPAMDEAKRNTFGLVKEFLSLAGVHHLDRPGFEADDLISYYVSRREPGERVVILSSDKDFLQLLDDDVEQVRLSAGGAPTDRWTRQRVIEEYGTEPQHLALAMALAGDVSDGVPGVRGYGMKTAIKRLSQAGWSLEQIKHESVRDNWDQVQTSLRLVDLREPHPDMVLPSLPPFEPTRPDSALFEALVAFLVRYELESVRGRVYAGGLWRESP